MKQESLNRMRRMAGVPQDFTADKKPKPVVEDVVPGMSQILRGGKHKFYLVTNATEKSDLGDVITEVDIRALTNILKGAGDGGAKDWELFPHNKQNDALNLARERLAKVGVNEVVGDGAFARNAHNVPLPSDEELAGLEQEEYEEYRDDDLDDDPTTDADLDFEDDDIEPTDADLDFEDDNDFEDDGIEPATNICPDCEGGEHPPAVGDCERCGGEGEVFEAKEEQEEVKKCACGCDPKKCKCPADCKCGCGAEEVKEHYHSVDSYPHTNTDSGQPHNVDASYDTVYDKDEKQSQRSGDDYKQTNDTETIKVPPKVLSELKRVITDMKSESEKAKPRDFESHHYYADTAEALQTVYDYLNEKTIQGLKQAQVYSQRMMNIQRVHMPDVVWKFLANGGVTRSLKSYVSDVKNPITGKPFGIVPIATLNKNTHTE